MNRRRRSRAAYAIALVTALGLGLIVTFVWGRTYSSLALEKEPFQRLAYVPSFDPIEDVTLGLPPDASNKAAAKPSLLIRAIVVYPTQIVMLSGGKAYQTIDVKAPSTLNQLVKVVDNIAWIRRDGSVVTLNTALILANGSAMTIASPETTQLVMSVREGVFLGASAATLTLDHVYVHASDPYTPVPFGGPGQLVRRPFILASSHATMTIKDSTFRYLGRDWNSSYGVSWSKGATGSVTNSLFEDNFIGVYSNASNGLRVESSRFYHNSLYGIDPHSGSTNLLIENNVANDNGRHGIIFSDHVTHSVVRGNTVMGNGLNGIMMDAASTGNVIADNVVMRNLSDGIVLANSGGNVVTSNRLFNNRIGISARGSSAGTLVSRNVVKNNRLGLQGSFHLRANTVSDNGGEWSARRIVVIWAGDGVLLIVCVAVTWTSNARRRWMVRRIRRMLAQPAGVG